MSGVASYLAVAGFPNRNQGALTLTHGAYQLAYAETSEVNPGLTNFNKYSTYTDFPVTNLLGNWAAVDRDFLCLISTAAYPSGIMVVARFRKAPGATPTTLQLGEFGPSDRGLNTILTLSNLAQLGTSGANKLAFTAVRQIGIFQTPPKMTFSGGVATFLKDFDYTYSGQNYTPDPIANYGNHLVLFGTGTQPYFSGGITITANNYFWTNAFGTITASFVPYWDGNDPSTISTSGQNVIISNLYPGFHILKVVITSNAGSASQTAYRYIWVYQDDDLYTRTRNFQNYDYPASVLEVKSDRHTPDGRQIELSLDGTTYGQLLSQQANTDIRGSMLLYFERTITAPYDPAPVVTQMAGWRQEINSTTDANTREAEFTLYGPGQFLNQGQATAFMLTNIGTAAPSDWYSIHQAFANSQFPAAYILNYHVRGWRQLFDLHIFGLGDALGYNTQFPGTFVGVQPTGASELQYILINQGTILEQIRNLVQRHMLSFNIDSNGHMWMLPDPAFQHPSLYPGSPIVLTGASFSKVATKHLIRPVTRAVRGEGLAFDGTNTTGYLSDATGPVPSQGQNDQSLQLQMLSYNGSLTNVQAELNLRVALLYMKLNNPFPQIQLTIPRNDSRFDPAQFPVVQWNPIGIAFAELPDLMQNYGNPWWAVVTDVERSHKDNGAIDTTLTIALLPEMYPTTVTPTVGVKVAIPPVTA